MASDTITQYALKWFNKKHELFARLVDADNRDPGNYPAFERLYKQLETRLTRDEVRVVLRNYLRRKFADERQAYFLTDVQEDKQLQRAVFEIASKIGLKLETIPRYAPFAGKPEGKSEDEPKATP